MLNTLDKIINTVFIAAIAVLALTLLTLLYDVWIGIPKQHCCKCFDNCCPCCIDDDCCHCTPRDDCSPDLPDVGRSRFLPPTPDPRRHQFPRGQTPDNNLLEVDE